VAGLRKGAAMRQAMQRAVAVLAAKAGSGTLPAARLKPPRRRRQRQAWRCRSRPWRAAAQPQGGHASAPAGAQAWAASPRGPAAAPQSQRPHADRAAANRRHSAHLRRRPSTGALERAPALLRPQAPRLRAWTLQPGARARRRRASASQQTLLSAPGQLPLPRSPDVPVARGPHVLRQAWAARSARASAWGQCSCRSCCAWTRLTTRCWCASGTRGGSRRGPGAEAHLKKSCSSAWMAHQEWEAGARNGMEPLAWRRAWVRRTLTAGTRVRCAAGAQVADDRARVCSCMEAWEAGGLSRATRTAWAQCASRRAGRLQQGRAAAPARGPS